MFFKIGAKFHLWHEIPKFLEHFWFSAFGISYQDKTRYSSKTACRQRETKRKNVLVANLKTSESVLKRKCFKRRTRQIALNPSPTTTDCISHLCILPQEPICRNPQISSVEPAKSAVKFEAKCEDKKFSKYEFIECFACLELFFFAYFLKKVTRLKDCAWV